MSKKNQTGPAVQAQSASLASDLRLRVSLEEGSIESKRTRLADLLSSLSDDTAKALNLVENDRKCYGTSLSQRAIEVDFLKASLNDAEEALEDLVNLLAREEHRVIALAHPNRIIADAPPLSSVRSHPNGYVQHSLSLLVS